MALFDQTLDDVLVTADDIADDLVGPFGTSYDSLGNDNDMMVFDGMFANMDYSILSSDTLSIDPDALALAATYQYNLQDLIILQDSLFVETAFNTDTIEVADSVQISRTVGVTPTDSMTLTDLAVTGFVRWITTNDSIQALDQVLNQISYDRSLSDRAVMQDVIHTWQTLDGRLGANLEGSAILSAILIFKEEPARPAGMPAREVKLPKTPPVIIEYNVINPNPPRRGIT